MTKEEILAKDKISKEEFKLLLNDIHKINCLDFLKKLPDNCIDIVVTSPPYNMGNTDRSENPKRPTKDGDKMGDSSRNNTLFNTGYSDFDDCLPYTVYIQQQRTLLKEMCRCLTDDGAIFYNNKWRVYDGVLDMLTEITTGFNVRQVIIWNKFSTLTFTEKLFMPVYEVIYFITKNTLSTGNKTELTHDGACMKDIWDFAAEKNNPHPAPYPIQLPYNAIHALNKHNKKMVVYDPYMGSGTTACAALAEGCHYIGTDLSESYIEMAKKRIEQNKICPEVQELGHNKDQAKNFKKTFNRNDNIEVKQLGF